MKSIILDNNIIDKIYKIPKKRRLKFVKNLKNQRYKFLSTNELLSELLSMYETKRRELMRRYCELYWLIFLDKFIIPWKYLVEIELGIRPEEIVDSFFNKKKLKKEINNIIKKSEDFRLYNDLHKKVKEDKGEIYRILKEKQIEFRKKGLREYQKKSKGKNVFEEFFDSSFSIKERKDVLTNFFNKRGKRLTVSKINDILFNPQKYPYFYYSSRCYMYLFYKIISNKKIDFGDSYDLFQLIYLVDIDYFVSEDENLKDICSMIYPGKEKILSFKEFTSLENK